MIRLATCALLAIAVWAPTDAHAAKVKVWHQYTYSHYDKAKFHQAVVTSEGTLRLVRQVKPLANLEAANVWALAEDKAGNLYAATGDEGKLYKITSDGKSSVVYTSGDSQILALAQLPDGTLYAGTGPGGKLVRIGADGMARTVAENLGSYIWTLAYDPASQSLFIGTGPTGKIYRLPIDGKPAVFYETKQEHVLCLALDAKGTLYAGTDKGGLVYRFVNGQAKGFVVFHAHQAEVRTLLVTPEAVCAGTSAPIARKSSGFPPAKGDDTKLSTPPAGENSLYRIAPDGTVREVYRDKTLVLGLLRQKGRLLVGTGMQGQLFEIDETTRERSELARLDSGAIQCLHLRRDGSVILGTGDPGKLYILEDRFAAQGAVLSDVLDAKIPSRWGSLSWQPHTPPGTKITVAVRSGNVAEPDATWSDWSAEQADGQNAKAEAPSARYLQYRVTLSSERPNATPELRNFALRYQSTNQAPELTSLEVPDLSTANLDNPRKLKLKWAATDPNDDELTYNVYYRKDGWKDWVLLEENLEKKEFEWDTTGVPSGMYQIKVVASDRHDNAPEETSSAERVSVSVPVSQVPPTVTLKATGVDGDRHLFEASATDPYLRLTEAAYTVNGKRWINVFPTDGLFDSKTETFRFRTDSLRPGTNVVVLRVRDAAGNYGAADVLVTVPKKD